MRKTLLVAAVALAAAAISVKAQVYSQNVVGYYNIVTPSHKFNFFANQLVNGSDANQTNDNVNTVLSTGFVSDPNGVTNSVLYVWTGAGYGIILTYYTDADAATALLNNNGNGWYDGSGNLSSTKVNQGVAGFIYNAATVPMTNTLTGTVPQGTNYITVPTGYSTYSIYEPVSTNLASGLLNFPATSDPNGVNNDVYYLWTGSGYGVILTYYTDADAAAALLNNSGNGWYDGSGNNQNNNSADWPSVGQGFIIHHIVAPVTWTNAFTVQ